MVVYPPADGRPKCRHSDVVGSFGNGGGPGRRRSPAATALPPPSPSLPPPPPSFVRPNTKYEAGGRMAVSSTDPTELPSLSSSLPSLPFHPGLLARLCFRRLLGPNSSHFEENILQRKFKSFCRRPLNQGVYRSFNDLRNYSKT